MVDEDRISDEGEQRHGQSKVLQLIPLPAYKFTQIIDADHFTIQRIAASIRKVISPIILADDDHDTNQNQNEFDIDGIIVGLKPLLLEATWRLIRHDLSEDLVMRPAFTQILGETGTRMADEDRADHAAGRRALVRLIDEFETLESQRRAAADDHSERRDVQRLQSLATSITATFDDLAKHMAVESGEFLPRFEKLVDGDMSKRLAAEYCMTLFMTPYRMEEWLSGDDCTSSTTSDNTMAKPERTSSSSQVVSSYVRMDMETMRHSYHRMMQRCQGSDTIRSNVRDAVTREFAQLQVGKWTSISQQGDEQYSRKDKLKL